MFESIGTKNLSLNPFEKIGSEKMLITASDQTGCNTMTASWGTMGTLWNKPVVTAYVRPSRYTHDFTETGDIVSFSFFTPGHVTYPDGKTELIESDKIKKIFSICGTKCGRNTDKIALCHLTPLRHPCGAVYFEESSLVIIGKKLYSDEIKSERFVDESCSGCYANDDFHTFYVYEVIDILRRIE